VASKKIGCPYKILVLFGLTFWPLGEQQLSHWNDAESWSGNLQGAFTLQLVELQAASLSGKA
jgi:hypothetical protein